VLATRRHFIALVGYGSLPSVRLMIYPVFIKANVLQNHLTSRLVRASQCGGKGDLKTYDVRQLEKNHEIKLMSRIK
jgi:hypothetical protein